MATNAVDPLDSLNSTANNYHFTLPSCGDLLTDNPKVRGVLRCLVTLSSETKPIVQYLVVSLA